MQPIKMVTSIYYLCQVGFVLMILSFSFCNVRSSVGRGWVNCEVTGYLLSRV